MNSPTQNGKKTLITLALVFILPVAAAKLVLSLDLYHGGATNQGVLMPTDISYQSLSMANPQPQRWQVIYLLPNQCDQLCKDRLYILHQSHIALGKDQDRVNTLIMTQNDSDIKAIAEFNFTTATANDALASLLVQHQMIIVDPLGSLIMRYDAVSGHKAQLQQGKALVSDLRKMLKLSRIG